MENLSLIKESDGKSLYLHLLPVVMQYTCMYKHYMYHRKLPNIELLSNGDERSPARSGIKPATLLHSGVTGCQFYTL